MRALDGKACRPESLAALLNPAPFSYWCRATKWTLTSMPREASNAAKVDALMRRLGGEARGPGTVYLVGGASAVLIGWRPLTVDVDLKLAPEPAGVFDAMRRAKEALDINIELAAPDDFIPALPGWQERSPFIARHGSVEFRHYDFYAQALAKIERGHAQDSRDVRAMADRGLIEPRRLMAFFVAIEPDLPRYPAIDATAFRQKVVMTSRNLAAPRAHDESAPPSEYAP